MVEIKALVAGNGDCVIISYQSSAKKTTNILIDGGNGLNNYKEHLKPVTEKIIDNGQILDLIIISHIDQDHIKGIIYLARDVQSGKSKIKESHIAKYWFNSAKLEKLNVAAKKTFDISVSEMKELEKFLHGQPEERWSVQEKLSFPNSIEFNGANITILSPDQEILKQFAKDFGGFDIAATGNDYEMSLKELYAIEEQKLKNNEEDLDSKFENSTSIAFLFEYQNKSILHLGDAVPVVVDYAIKHILEQRNIKRLTVDVVKLSHHASRKSLSFNFLDMVHCTKFIVSANGKKAGLPNKSTFAKILLHPERINSIHVEFYFNYPVFSKILQFTEEEKAEYNFSCHDANNQHGYYLPI